MIYVTGDTHGDVRRLGIQSFPEQKDMSKDDVVIILGDFGLIWAGKETKDEKFWLDWLESKPFTTVFLDGNHENHTRLKEYPQKEWRSGRVHEIRPSVLHLMRGEYFDIDGTTFFCMGGAKSHDISDGILNPHDPQFREKYVQWSKQRKMFRVNGVSWWEEELPSEEEMNHGRNVLDTHGNKVDFILAHSPSAFMVAMLGNGLYEQDSLTLYLEDICKNTDYTKFLCGHMHVNQAVTAKDIVIYEQIIRVA